MSVWKLVRLQFTNNGAHFGEVGIGLEQTGERVRSDTLFSALINSYARLFGGQAVEDLLQQFIDFPPVRLSSTFIYHQQDKQITYYLPKPLKFPHKYPQDNDLSFFKAYKNLKYLPLSVWKKWYQGNGFDTSDLEEIRFAGRLELETPKQIATKPLQKAAVFDYTTTYQIHKVPKVAIDRTTAATNFYHTGLVKFNSQDSISGLYFLLHFPKKDEALEKNIYAALHLLGEDGLGGERSSGAGRFDIAYWKNFSEDWQQIVNFKQGNNHTSLSLFWTDKLEENFLEDSSYELIERGGWIGSSFSGRQLRRQKVQMFAEGSVFKQSPLGKLANVTPKGFNAHNVYRSGISLSIPIRC